LLTADPDITIMGTAFAASTGVAASGSDRARVTLREHEVKAMRAKLFVGVAGIGLLLAAVPVAAHHAFAAEFDANKPVKLTGTVTKMDWINPHAWIHIDVKKPDGTVEQWMIEGGTPNAMFRRGFTKDSLAPGTVIVVDGYQAKNGSLRANGRDLKLPDGRTLFVGSSGTGAPDERPDK
jgi:Family of unknown function (DUF6152)